MERETPALRPDRDDALRPARRDLSSSTAISTGSSASADDFGFQFDRHAARNELQAATFGRKGGRWSGCCCRRSGTMAIEVKPFEEPDARPVRWRCAAAGRSERFPPALQDHRPALLRRGAAGGGRVRDDLRRSGRVADRGQPHQHLRRARRAAADPAARPRAASGDPAGQADREGGAEEADLTPEDLEDGFFIGNMVRGLIPAKLA